MTTTTLYSIGQNIPGYLPMADEPTLFTTHDDAKRALIDVILNAADNAACMDNETHAESLSAAAEDVNLWSGDDYTIVTDPERKHDLGIAYWITTVDAADIDADVLAEMGLDR